MRGVKWCPSSPAAAPPCPHPPCFAEQELPPGTRCSSCILSFQGRRMRAGLPPAPGCPPDGPYSTLGAAAASHGFSLGWCLLSPFPRAQAALCPFPACRVVLQAPFLAGECCSQPYSWLEGSSRPLLPGTRCLRASGAGCSAPSLGTGLLRALSWAAPSKANRRAFPQRCLPRLPPACQRVRGVLLASLMLWSPELERLSLKPCPVGPGIMNIRTLAFYVNTY